MEVHFKKNHQMRADQVEVTVEAQMANQAVTDLLAYLRRYQLGNESTVDLQAGTDRPVQARLEGQYLDSSTTQATTAQPGILSVKTADEIILLKVTDLILIDIEGGQLVITTTKQQVFTKERLGHFVDRLGQANFVQISKHAVINLDHLQSLTNSFSGNMTAELTGGNQSLVSRRYVKGLMAHLGL